MPTEFVVATSPVSSPLLDLLPEVVVVTLEAGSRDARACMLIQIIDYVTGEAVVLVHWRYDQLVAGFDVALVAVERRVRAHQLVSVGDRRVVEAGAFPAGVGVTIQTRGGNATAAVSALEVTVMTGDAVILVGREVDQVQIRWNMAAGAEYLGMGSQQLVPVGDRDVIERRVGPRQGVMASLAVRWEVRRRVVGHLGREVLLLMAREAVDVQRGEGTSQIRGVAGLTRYLKVGACQGKIRLHMYHHTGHIGERDRVVAAYAVVGEVAQVDVHVAATALQLGDLRLIESQVEMAAAA